MVTRRDVVRPVAGQKLSEGRLPALDEIRGLAVLGVLLVHANGLLDTTRRLDRALAALSEFGAYGVDLFFVLSGFLITGILVDTSGSSSYFRTFYARRFLRLFPIYYGYLLVVALVFPLCITPPTRQCPILAAAGCEAYGSTLNKPPAQPLLVYLPRS